MPFPIRCISKPKEKRIENIKEAKSNPFLPEVALEIVKRLGLPPPSSSDPHNSSNNSLWYSLTPSQLLRHGGLNLPWRYLASISLFARTLYPEHPWRDILFQSRPLTKQELWSNPKNIRASLLYIAEGLGFDGENMESWYQLSQKAMVKMGARHLLPQRGGKLRLLRVAFPEHEWDVSRFKYKLKRHWESSENIREAVYKVGEHLGIQRDDFEAWYKVNHVQLLKAGLPATLLKDRSRFELFSTIFPEHKWSPYLFVRSTSIDTLSASREELVQLTSDLETLLNISNPESWFDVTKNQLHSSGFQHFFPDQAHLIAMLQVVYPTIDWNPLRFTFGARGFGALFSNLVRIFGHDVVVGKQFSSSSPLTPKVVLDDFDKAFFIPRFHLLFHYHGPLDFAEQLINKNDPIVCEDRRSLAKWSRENGFTLITVPFWMERDQTSLLGEIYHVRPELFADTAVLSSHRDIASSQPSFPKSLPRARLSLSRKYITYWKRDSRFALLARIAKKKLSSKKPRLRRTKPTPQKETAAFEE